MSEKPKLDCPGLKPAPMGEPIPVWPPDFAGEPLEGWQPIETAPKDGTEILLFGTDGIRIGHWVTRYGSGFWDTGYASEVDGDPIEVSDPTDWMPLPDEPEDWRSEMIHLGI